MERTIKGKINRILEEREDMRELYVTKIIMFLQKEFNMARAGVSYYGDDGVEIYVKLPDEYIKMTGQRRTDVRLDVLFSRDTFSLTIDIEGKQIGPLGTANAPTSSLSTVLREKMNGFLHLVKAHFDPRGPGSLN